MGTRWRGGRRRPGRTAGGSSRVGVCLACGGREQCADCVRLLALYVAGRVRPERVEVAGWVEPMLSFEWGDDCEGHAE